MKRRGRPILHATTEQKAAARKTSKEKFKNISLDADLVDRLNAVADRMAEDLGFRPTLSQAVRALIKLAESK